MVGVILGTGDWGKLGSGGVRGCSVVRDRSIRQRECTVPAANREDESGKMIVGCEHARCGTLQCDGRGVGVEIARCGPIAVLRSGLVCGGGGGRSPVCLFRTWSVPQQDVV